MAKTSGELWPRFRPLVAGQPVGDLAELAARLESIITYSRSGSVVYADGFGGGLAPYHLSSVSPGYTVTLDHDVAFRGCASAKLFSDKDYANAASCNKYLPLYRTGRMGFECHFAPDDNYNIWSFGLTKTEGGIVYAGVVTVKVEDQTVTYRDSDGNHIGIGTPNLTKGTPRLWHAIKLFMDFDTNAWIKVWLDDNEYDLDGEALRQTASGNADSLLAAVSFGRDPDNDTTGYLDDFIVTIDEP